MFNPESYTIIAHWLPRLLGVIYFFSFGALFFQIRGLIGSNGILPVTPFFNRLEAFYPRRCYYYLPSIFWINSSDSVLEGVTLAGTVISVFLVLGFLPPLMLLLLYVLYLSIVAAGQDFLAFGWEGLLLETTAHVFLISLTTIPVTLVWISLNFLLFRFHLMAGVVKLQSHDPSWRNFSAIAYHYQSQPIPNLIAWYVHKLPLWFHQFTVGVMFFIEIVLPFGIFATDQIRYIVFLGFFLLQFGIWFTGNFSFLNYLTVVLSTVLLSNFYLQAFLPTPPQQEAPFIVVMLISVMGTGLLFLQVVRFYHQLMPNQLLSLILARLSPFYLANRYGIFAVMTTTRYEVVIEGSEDGIQWKEYGFKHKPSLLSDRPHRIAPYQPRLDWQIWFTPFTGYSTGTWFHSFLKHLLMGTPEVLALIKSNPFPVKPPHYIRAKTFIYEFTTFEEKQASGLWWKRKFFNDYSPVLTLKDF